MSQQQPSDAYLRNAAKPQGAMGEEVLTRMNEHHRDLADWAFQHVHVPTYSRLLDIGCGGGANLQRLLAQCPDGVVEGVDYSPTSVALSTKNNRTSVNAGRCIVTQGDVGDLPYPDNRFDFACACETVYFWPDLQGAFDEVQRVLRPGAQFLIICEMGDPDDPRFADADFITVYTGEDLRDALQDAGFQSAVLRTQGDWFCIVATV
ncbi:class I SAM-dependent methyltransferase [Hugonella massiliensis]|uniref:class I SAM-dependent methyltransferase n=1 Tax=Hugonella massiliensis TaxID=1720315 RepID=UPI00073F66E6|nr:class I SAM-dependent methyltransferase [Hugonella massiliensis]